MNRCWNGRRARARVDDDPGRLGREMLEWTSIRLMQAAQYYWPLTADGQPKFRAVEAKDRSGQPILDANGKPTFNQVPVGDIDKFMEIAAALSLIPPIVGCPGSHWQAQLYCAGVGRIPSGSGAWAQTQLFF